MISNRIKEVQDPVIPIVGRWTRENPGTISLGQGIVHYPPPPEVLAAVSRKVDLADPLAGSGPVGSGLDRYGPVDGDQVLIDAITRKLNRDNGIDPSGQQASVVCTAGANMGFLNAILAIADVGDEIILLGPYYFNHRMAIEIAGCRTVVVPTDQNHQPDLDAIRDAIGPRTRAVVTVSPNNPTGAVYSRADVVEINSMCASHGVYHISDEAYEYFLHHNVNHYSPGSENGSSAHTISLFSLSKSYGLAGWRVGYMVVPDHLTHSVKKIQDTNLICLPIVCQVAAAAALDVGSQWCRNQVPELTKVRDAAVARLSELGPRCHIAPADGAFYLFLSLKTQREDMKLVETLIREYGVAVLPGSAFGATATCSLRISYGALGAESVGEGIGRLHRGLNELL